MTKYRRRLKTNEPGEIQRDLRRLAAAQGFNRGLSVEIVHGQKGVRAGINLGTDDIELKIGADWNPLQYEHIGEFARSLRGVRDIKKKELEDVIFHEMGHYRLKNAPGGLGCPESLFYKEKVFNAVAKVCKDKGIDQPKAWNHLENCIDDIIDNINASQFTSYNGQVAFWAEQGELSGGKYSPLYEAFVKLNMYLMGSRKQKKFLSQYYTNEERVDEAVNNCIRRLRLGDNKDNNIRRLFDKKRWERTYTIFAEELVKLMDVSSPEVLFGVGSGGGYAAAGDEGDGEGSKPGEDGKGQGYIIKPGDEGDKKGIIIVPGDGDPLFKKMMDPANIKKAMLRRHNEGEEAPAYLENTDSLNFLYQALASELHIKVETIKKGLALPVAAVGQRAFDPDKDRLEDIIFGKLLFDDNGNPLLAVPRNHIEIIAKYKHSPKSYPELNICKLDTSGSMTQAANAKGIGKTNVIPWGDNSKYHWALITYFGVVKALDAMGVAQKTRYNMITFGDRTDATGEKSFDQMGDIKERLFNPVWGGWTYIDVDVLASQAKQPGSVLMTISDGQIQNWNHWYNQPEYDESKVLSVRNGNPANRAEDGVYALRQPGLGGEEEVFTVTVKDGQITHTDAEMLGAEPDYFCDGRYVRVEKAGKRVKDRFREIISDKFYVHFQIGPESVASRDIARWGGTVIPIQDASSMPEKAIDIAKGFYKSFATTEVFRLDG